MNDVRVTHRSGGEWLDLTLTGLDLAEADALTLRDAFTRALEQPHLRLVTIRGGENFCTGRGPDLTPTAITPDPARVLDDIPAPVVVALTGRTSSVGLEIALAADLRIAAPGCTFDLPQVGDGELPAWGGTQRLPRAAGRSLAVEMVLLGRKVDASRALATGLVHEVCDDPGARVDEIAASLLGGPPLAQAYAKTAVRLGSELTMRAGMQLEADLNAYLRGSADRAEGLDAFFHGRSPRFEGR